MLKRIFLTASAMLFLIFSTADAAKSAETYEYVSREYNYSLECPKRPNVVPANVYYEDAEKKGEVLIFDNEGYTIKRAWIILFDAFDTTMIPNFNKDSKKFIEQYIEAKKKDEFDELNLVEIQKGNKGVFGITAKEIEIDEDGDGKIDGVAVADKQAAVVFFRSDLGRCISVQLFDENFGEASIAEFRTALSTYKEVDPNAKSKNAKKDKKSKK